MLVQPANVFDISTLNQLEKICFPQDAWPLIDLVSCLTFPGVLRFKAVEDGQMVGFVAADDREATHTAWIATLCVHPDHQRKGFAKMLLEQIENRVKSPYIRLCVRPNNTAAIKLYEDRGYVEIDTWKKYYNDGTDALVMEKLISDPNPEP